MQVIFLTQIIIGVECFCNYPNNFNHQTVESFKEKHLTINKYKTLLCVLLQLCEE